MIPDKYSGNPFADSDRDDDGNEDGKSSKKKAKKSNGDSASSGDQYAGSIRLKEGRNVQNNLYYVDHSKLSNEGNGLLIDARNELLLGMQSSNATYDQLSQQLKSITAEAVQLESELKNEELILEVVDFEKREAEMDSSLQDARAVVCGEFFFSHQILTFMSHQTKST